MVTAKKTPLDLMDEIYSLAYWLTASESQATELVNNTYLNLENDSSETDVYKTFRVCYLDSIGIDVSEPDTPCTSKELPQKSLINQVADIQLSVLLSAIAGLRHRDISRIIGKPLDTIRVWLSEGRKSLAQSACVHPIIKFYYRMP